MDVFKNYVIDDIAEHILNKTNSYYSLKIGNNLDVATDEINQTIGI